MHEVRALLWKDWRVALNVRRLLAEQSRFKLVFILLFATGLLGGLGWLFFRSFQFLEALGGMGLVLIHRIFYLFFFSLGGLLLLSSVLTSYVTLFRSDETGYLLLRPIPIGALTLYKTGQAAVLTSWAFFFMIVPFVGAFAWHARLPPAFFIGLLIFSPVFVLFFSSAGTLISLAGLRYWPRGPVARRIGVGLLGLAVAAGVAAIWATRPAAGGLFSLERLIPGLKWSAHPLWPSRWMAEGCMALARGEWSRALGLWCVLLSNLLLVGLFIESAGRRWFLANWQRVHYSPLTTRRRGLLLAALAARLRRAPPDIRAMVVKDARLFLRDPAQWSQALFFFGLLGLYFFNLRTFRYHQLPDLWRNLISFMNVFSVSAVMASLGARFVYPQLSLEGQSFWILGMAPTTMGRVLAAKFLHAFVGLELVSLSLMGISAQMLSLPIPLRGAAFLVAASMALVVAALSTGLGAVFMDLKQRNLSAIVSGFGGTLNLVANLAYMLLAIVPLGLIFHRHLLSGAAAAIVPRGFGLAAGWVAGSALALSAAALLAGRRSLNRREFG